MVSLPSITERQSLGIDSFERALVWSGLTIYRVFKQSPDLQLQRAINFDLPNQREIRATLNLEVNLPLNKIKAAQGGGDMLSALTEYQSSPPAQNISCVASSENFVALEIPPAQVNSLEKFFAWSAYQIKNRQLQAVTTEGEISIRFLLEAQDFAKLQIQAQIPVSYPDYLKEGNLVCNLLPMYRSFNQSFLLSDQLLLTDQLLLRD
jgi:hypothetical protein